jgi:23S rRNA (uridine2552-2'-O)-methyltransferase
MSEYNRKDRYYQEAKQNNLRSRAYFKLKELDQKYKLIKRGDGVLDLGCWPGGWLQYAAERVGNSGIVLGFDLKPSDEFNQDNIKTEALDLFADIDRALEICRSTFKNSVCDLVISDLSPKLSGIKSADRAQSIALVERAYYFAQELLAPGGHFISKVFKSNEAEEFIRTIRPDFTKVIRKELDSTRKTSNEFYIVGISHIKNYTPQKMEEFEQ